MYNAQIKYTESKLNQICGVLFRLSKFLNYEAARNMYNSCIYCVISYCIIMCMGWCVTAHLDAMV